jgi:uncharacterized protein (TIGR02246 family)
MVKITNTLQLRLGGAMTVYRYGIFFFACCLIATFVFAESAEQQLMAKERQMWELFKNKDDDAFSANLAKDATEYQPSGKILSRAEIVESMHENTLTDFALADMKVRTLGDDAALVTYKATVKATHMEQPMPEMSYLCSSVWVKQGGKWLAVFHQETAIMPQTQTSPSM